MKNETQIKRENLISDKALNWGKHYSKNVKKAIKANKKLVKSVAKFKKALKNLSN
jgi:hypothetical protein